jgi:hypothetical protein
VGKLVSVDILTTKPTLLSEAKVAVVHKKKKIKIKVKNKTGEF